LEKLDGPPGIGGGVLVILVAVNTAVPVFIAVFTALINWHSPASWRTPTLAFIFCVAAIRAMGSFDIQFAPFMLTTGAIVWLACCWLLHRKRAQPTEHAL